MSPIAWRPGMGDPTVFGYLATVGYLAAAAICFSVDRGAARRSIEWRILGVALAALGVNKQLDLQTLLVETARTWAIRDGWYAERHRAQLMFLVVVSVGAILTAGLVVAKARSASGPLRLAGCGVLLLVVYVAARASSLHKIDTLLGRSLAGATLSTAVELGGIAVVLVASAWAVTRRKRVGNTPLVEVERPRSI